MAKQPRPAPQKLPPARKEPTRVYMLVSCLVDDNDDILTAPVPLCGTASEKIARAAVQVFVDHENASRTMLHRTEIENRLPGLLTSPEDMANLAGMVEGIEENAESPADVLEVPAEDPMDRLCGLVDMG